MNRENRRQWSRMVALSLTGGTVVQFLPPGSLPERVLAQPATPQLAACSEISAPLTPEEQVYARAAWQYFVNNYQPATGFVNSTGGYPSGTLWDMANYLTAMNAALSLNIINQGDFDTRLNKFLTTLSGLKLFDGALPNKVYNAATGEMTDYGNNPKPRGIGWSALDVGRMLAAFHIIRTCHPQYADWLKGIVDKWKLEQSLKDGELYGTAVLPDDKTLLVQEGRLGYEEYAARGYQLWGFKPDKAIAAEPLQFVKINNLNIPADTRDYKSTNANNYVVSESYILDAIEFGLQGYLQDYAASVFEAQKRHYETTKELTAVSEDNIDQAPYFLYNTVYSNGVAWATITDENKPYPQLRTLSTKAAFGWRYLYPTDPYAQQVFEVAKELRSPDGGGFYAGLYQETKQPNKALTGNTNGLILEILHFKARGNRPLVTNSNQVTFAQAPPTGNNINLVAASPATSTPGASAAPAVATAPTVTPTVTPTPPIATAAAPPRSVDARVNPPPTPANSEATAVAVAPIPPVGNPLQAETPKLARPLKVQERRYAEAAWNYFQANYEANTGLVSDRSDVKGVTPWGMGDYLAAMHAARSLDILSPEEFDRRTRLLLGALKKLPLYGKQLPSRGYDPRTLQPIDYGGNPVKEGTGWSALDIGRLLAGLYNLKSSHPEYTKAVDEILLDWSYLQVVRDRRLISAIAQNDENKPNSQAGENFTLKVVYPENRLGYEEYAARGFQLWGFEVDRSAVGGNYQTAPVEGVDVPTKRIRPDVNPDENKYTVSSPFLLYGLEFGIEPQMRKLFEPIRRAQELRYRRTGTLTAGGTTAIDGEPYVIHSTAVAGTEPWATIGDNGKPFPDRRVVSTATSFALHALYPEDEYAKELWHATTDLYTPTSGYYEGFYEKTGKPTQAFSSSTNSIVLQSLLYMASDRQPVVRSTANFNSPWWQAVAKGDTSRGLPIFPTSKARLIADASGAYWASAGNDNPPQVTLARANSVVGVPAPLPSAPTTQAVNPPPQTTPAAPQTASSQPPTQEFTAPPVSSAPRVPSVVTSPATPEATPTPRASSQPPVQEFTAPPVSSPPPVPRVATAPTTPYTTPRVLSQPRTQTIAAVLPDRLTTDANVVAAQIAWQYFDRNWNPDTGLVNSTDNSGVTNLWAQGSGILGIHAARQLGLIDSERFNRRMGRMLQTLETLPLPGTALSNNTAYNTSTGQITRRDRTPDSQQRSGEPSADAARLLLGLHVLRENYPEYGDRINKLVDRWNLPQVVKNGLLQGAASYQSSIPPSGQQSAKQYAANILKLWNVEVPGLNNATVQVAQSNASNFGSIDDQRIDPYILWGLELGWPNSIKTQLLSQLKAQAQESYFKYYSASNKVPPWMESNAQIQANAPVKFLSTKTAFAWESLLEDDLYAQTLRQYVQNLAEENRGYLSGRFENAQQSRNASIDVNTNAMILESLLYQARNGRPLAF